MGYTLWAFVAKSGTFNEFKSQSPYITVAELNQGFSLMLNDPYLQALPQFSDTGSVSGFEQMLLTPSLITFAQTLSEKQPIAYIEADYFGGLGRQNAVLWEHQQIKLLPANNGVLGVVPYHSGPICAVLRAMGVKNVPPTDEFASLGLLRHRHNEGWFAAATGFDIEKYYSDGNWG